MKVLVVEDDASTREVIQRVLGDEPSLELDAVARGDEAMAALDQDAFDVVLLDYRLPDTDGLQVLEQIQARHPGVAVVFLPGEGSETVAHEALRTGAVDYLVKDPATYQRLPATVQQAGNEWTGVGTLVHLEGEPAPEASPPAGAGGLDDPLGAFLDEVPAEGVVVHSRAGEVVLARRVDGERADRLAARASAVCHQSDRLARTAGTEETGAIHVIRGDERLLALAGGPGSLQLVTLVEAGTTVSNAIEIVRGIARVVRDQLDDAQARGSSEDAGEHG